MYMWVLFIQSIMNKVSMIMFPHAQWREGGGTFVSLSFLGLMINNYVRRVIKDCIYMQWNLRIEDLNVLY